MSLVGSSETENHNLNTIGSKLKPPNQILTKFKLLIKTRTHCMTLCKKKLKIMRLFKVYTLNCLIRLRTTVQKLVNPC